jgi:hypothetical protein
MTVDQAGRPITTFVVFPTVSETQTPPFGVVPMPNVTPNSDGSVQPGAGVHAAGFCWTWMRLELFLKIKFDAPGRHAK